MAFELISGRVLILPDDGSETTGVIVAHDTMGWRGLTIVTEVPINPEDPPVPPKYYTHVVFVKEGAVEVEIDSVTYLAMHRNNIIGTLSD